MVRKHYITPEAFDTFVIWIINFIFILRRCSQSHTKGNIFMSIFHETTISLFLNGILIPQENHEYHLSWCSSAILRKGEEKYIMHRSRVRNSVVAPGNLYLVLCCCCCCRSGSVVDLFLLFMLFLLSCIRLYCLLLLIV